MADHVLLDFDGLSQPVALVDSRDLLACFDAVFRGWRITELTGTQTAPPIITVRGGATGYALEAPWLKTPVHHRDKATALSAFIAELVRAQVRTDPQLLCLHGAAAEFAGKLVVFPSRYRAGKSVLCACLAAGGVRLFGDDVLPIRAPDDHGVAPGVMPRLRLPLPDDLGPAVGAFLDRHRGLAGKRYLYLDLSCEQLAERGTAAPVGGFVLLERDPEARPAFSPVGPGEVLRQVIWQNFARAGAPADIMDRLHRLVDGARRYRLRYAKAEQAVVLLKEAFADWSDRAARAGPRPLAGSIPGRTPEPLPAPRDPNPPPGCYRRDPTVSEKLVDGERFLAGSDGTAIHHLNPVGSALWLLLAEPMTIGKMVDLLHAAFPDVARERIDGDVRALVRDLAAKRLLVAGPDTAPAGEH